MCVSSEAEVCSSDHILFICAFVSSSSWEALAIVRVFFFTRGGNFERVSKGGKERDGQAPLTDEETRETDICGGRADSVY